MIRVIQKEASLFIGGSLSLRFYLVFLLNQFIAQQYAV